MNNTLIVYYSLFQNTKNLALEIAKQTGGTIRELTPVIQTAEGTNEVAGGKE